MYTYTYRLFAHVALERIPMVKKINPYWGSLMFDEQSEVMILLFSFSLMDD
jgi:hypothetical protein